MHHSSIVWSSLGTHTRAHEGSVKSPKKCGSIIFPSRLGYLVQTHGLIQAIENLALNSPKFPEEEPSRIEKVVEVGDRESGVKPLPDCEAAKGAVSPTNNCERTLGNEADSQRL